MRARKLPSGSWRCQVFSHYDERGKMIRKSFTVSDPSPAGRRTCEALASAWAAEHPQPGKRIGADVTFGQAVQRYISARAVVLSPTTLSSYRYIVKTHFGPLLMIPVRDIDSEAAQELINRVARERSPKTTRNVWGLFRSVMDEAAPDVVLRVNLPEKRPPARTMPTEAEAHAIIDAVKGTVLALPVALAVYGPMRRGEICALRAENIAGNTVHVCESMARKIEEHKVGWVIKQTKTAAGDRFIEYPDFVARMWEGKKEGRLINMNPDTLSNEFRRTLKRKGLPAIRFHDLRHYSASVLHALGIPDAYIMRRGGWGDDRTLKEVYRHTVSEAEREITDRINDYFTRSAHDK